MRSFLIAVPLLLVFVLLFVKLPNTRPGRLSASISTQTNPSENVVTSISNQAFVSGAIAP